MITNAMRLEITCNCDGARLVAKSTIRKNQLNMKFGSDTRPRKETYQHQRGKIGLAESTKKVLSETIRVKSVKVTQTHLSESSEEQKGIHHDTIEDMIYNRESKVKYCKFTLLYIISKRSTVSLEDSV